MSHMANVEILLFTRDLFFNAAASEQQDGLRRDEGISVIFMSFVALIVYNFVYYYMHFDLLLYIVG